jgi:hypothetical protein
MREMSVTEQRYKAVLAVIGDGRTVSEVATDWGVSRRTMHRWLVRYEGDGLEGLNNRSHRPAQSPHQMPPTMEAMVLEMRRSHPYCGARRIAFGPGCFVTVGNPPTKVAKTLTLTKVGSVLTLNIPDTEPIEQSEHPSLLGPASGALARNLS